MTSTTTVVPYQQPRQWLEVMSPAADLAKQIAGTEFVPKSIRNNPPAIAAAILFGDEVGFGPMQSLAKIAVIEGKPALAAEAQRALILRAGHELWLEEATTTKVTVCGRRKGSEQVTRITWTMDDAKRANLAGRPSWRTYPRQMLTARATAELARAVFADAIGGLMAIEELEEPADLPDEAVGNGAKTATRRTRRRKATALKPAVSSDPEEESKLAGLPPLPGEEGGAPLSPAASEKDAETPDDAPPLTSPDADEPLTLSRSKQKMDAIIGQLRDADKLSTMHLWSSMAQTRGIGVTTLIEELGGYDEDGVLHWSPLRDSLTLKEARELHGKLASYWINVQAAMKEEESQLGLEGDE